MKFHKGDRVVLIGDLAGGEKGIMPQGSEGTVVSRYGDSIVSVRWDNAFDVGHTINGLCEKFHGWDVFEDEIDFAQSIPETDPIDICGLL